MANKEKPILLGTAGKARAGKDTVAKILQGIIGGPVVTVAFATPIKEGVKAMFNLTEEHVNGALKEVFIPELGASPRRLLQLVGTEFGRGMLRADIWVQVAKRKILEELAKGNNVVVTDVRFENEAAMIRELGGCMWHVTRPGGPVIEQHESEAGINVALNDCRIVNDADITSLFYTVKETLEAYVKRAGVLSVEKAVVEYDSIEQVYQEAAYVTGFTPVDKESGDMAQLILDGPILKYDSVSEVYETPHVVYVPAK